MEFLKGILSDDLYKQVEDVINAHNAKEENKEKQIKIGDLGSGAYTSTEKFTALQGEKDNALKQLGEAKTLIETLKQGAKDDPDTKKKLEDYENKIKDLTAELAKERLENAALNALREAKGIDVDYLLFKLKNMDEELKLDENGKIKGIDDKIATLKTQFPSQFETSNGGDKKIDPQPLPNNGNPSSSNEPQSLEEAIRAHYTTNEE